jgi:hypothetical protein
LSLVGGGPDALRAAQRFGELRGRLPAQFQLVLLTGGTAQEGQTMLLAPHCDGVYLVVCLTSTRRTEALAAVESLRMAGADVLGTIVIAPQST